jgi:hypothetical protein
VLWRADKALLLAKQLGRNNTRLPTPELGAQPGRAGMRRLRVVSYTQSYAKSAWL